MIESWYNKRPSAEKKLEIVNNKINEIEIKIRQ
jgi:hypothetical protein